MDNFDKQKFKNKYRIKSTRLSEYDYSSNGAYFVTICVKNREHSFGEITDGKMALSDIGQIAHQCWRDIPNHFSFVALDESIIMPNHLHGVLRIQKPVVETQDFASLSNFASLQQNGRGNKFGPQSMNLASIIRGFKIGVKKLANNNNIDFIWQPGYYDRIIRNEEELNRVRQYIGNNPLKWEIDKNNLENLFM